MKQSNPSAHGISYGVKGLLLAMAVSFAASSSYAQTTAPANSQTAKPASSKAAKQTSFATPQDAANALIEATAKYDVPALLGIFGPAGRLIIGGPGGRRWRTTLPTLRMRRKKSHAVDRFEESKPRDPGRGRRQWPLPVPIVKTAGRWTFSTREGHTKS
jgi:hypothetical protein